MSGWPDPEDTTSAEDGPAPVGLLRLGDLPPTCYSKGFTYLVAPVVYPLKCPNRAPLGSVVIALSIPEALTDSIPPRIHPRIGSRRTLRQASLYRSVLSGIEAFTNTVAPVVYPFVRANGTSGMTVGYHQRKEDSDKHRNSNHSAHVCPPTGDGYLPEGSDGCSHSVPPPGGCQLSTPRKPSAATDPALP